MNENLSSIQPLEWKQNPVIIMGFITGFLLLITAVVFYSTNEQKYRITSSVLTILAGVLSFVFYQNQCIICKRVFSLKHVSNEILKKWEEQKQYKPKTIYYYSDGVTIKNEKFGSPKFFTAIYERHKDGFECKKCNNIQYKTKDIFINQKDWERINTPDKITTKTRVPKGHYNNNDLDFSLDLFDDSHYFEGSGSNKKRKTIPKTIKMDLWKKYNGKKYNGKCYVCSKKIDTHHFEAGHVKAVSKGGSDTLNNLKPICMGCNRSMGNMNLYDYKKRYHSQYNN